MIYGDDFPNAEQIVKEREIIFEPITLYSQKAEISEIESDLEKLTNGR